MVSSEKNSWLYTVCMVRDVNRETWVDVPCNQEVTMTVLPLLCKRNKQIKKKKLVSAKRTSNGDLERNSSKRWGGLRPDCLMSKIVHPHYVRANASLRSLLPRRQNMDNTDCSFFNAVFFFLSFFFFNYKPVAKNVARIQVNSLPHPPNRNTLKYITTHSHKPTTQRDTNQKSASIPQRIHNILGEGWLGTAGVGVFENGSHYQSRTYLHCATNKN